MEVTPNDLDIVVDASDGNQAALVAGLAEVDAEVKRRSGWQSLASASSLPWEWGFTARTVYGHVDVTTTFADGATIDDFEVYAISVELPSGSTVRCRPTRHVE